MDVGNAQKKARKLLDVFADTRLQDWDLDHMAQHYVHNAYPLLDMVDRLLTFDDYVRYHFDYHQSRSNDEQYTLF